MLSLKNNEISNSGAVASINLTRLIIVGLINSQFTRVSESCIMCLSPMGTLIFCEAFPNLLNYIGSNDHLYSDGKRNDQHYEDNPLKKDFKQKDL